MTTPPSRPADLNVLSKQALMDLVQAYHNAGIAKEDYIDLYQAIIFEITGRPAQYFYTESETQLTLQGPIIRSFRPGELQDQVTELGEALLEAKEKLWKLEQENELLQSSSKAKQVELEKLNQELKNELESLRSSDPIERRKQTLTNLFSKRKSISLASTGLRSNPDDDPLEEQKENEINIIEQSLSLIRLSFEDLPTTTSRVKDSTISFDLQPIFEQLKEARTQLSFMLPEEDFIVFLTAHLNELKELIELFKSKSSGPLTISLLTPYEKNILYSKEEESYLHGSDKRLDLQRRLLLSNRFNLKLLPFESFPKVSYCYLFSQIEDVVESLFIRFKPINNIVWLPMRYSPGPDYYSFYSLSSFGKDGVRLWKLESHLVTLTRIFMAEYSRVGAQVFRRFYRDVFGHNDYLPDFEGLLVSKGIEHWKQMSVLWQNLLVCGDEYLIGEIIRKIIRTKAPLTPLDHCDLIPPDKDSVSMMLDFKAMRARWSQELPAHVEEPEETFYTCFDAVGKWDQSTTRPAYYKRWKDFLESSKK